MFGGRLEVGDRRDVDDRAVRLRQLVDRGLRHHDGGLEVDADLAIEGLHGRLSDRTIGGEAARDVDQRVEAAVVPDGSLHRESRDIGLGQVAGGRPRLEPQRLELLRALGHAGRVHVAKHQLCARRAPNASAVA